MEIKFIEEISKYSNVLVVVTDSNLSLPKGIRDVEKVLDINILEYTKNHKFDTKHGEVFVIPTASEKVKNVVLISAGAADELDITKSNSLGGAIIGLVGRFKESKAKVYVCDSVLENKQMLFHIFLGALLKNYYFDKYKTKADPKEAVLEQLEVLAHDSHTLNLEFEQYKHLYEGIRTTRDLISEPANIKNPISIATQCKELTKLGIEVDVLDEHEMKKLGMGSLLGVGYGSSNPPRTVIMRFNGASKGLQPLAFVGKGVTFDSGGLSLKPAGSMIGMKYDMSGAAVVIGLLKTLALRKAKINVIGAIGLVENMPDGNAQRPEDIVKSMSGQTIEVLNTDAEGRLVLADVLWYVQSMYKPKFMIDLATLTGAIVVALGDKYAGLFSNNDELSERIHSTGLKVGEKVWRFPLDKEYDKMMDSKIADMQNISNESGAGSITAAQFLQRFVNDVPWVHLDIAGTAHVKKPSATHRGGATAFGVILLNQFLQDFYE